MSFASRSYPSWSYKELAGLNKIRSKSTHATKIVRDAMVKDRKWTFKTLGHNFRDQWWMNSWWKTWKSQWEVSRVESRREYYGLPPDANQPEWTHTRVSRLSLPTETELAKFSAIVNTKKAGVPEVRPVSSIILEDEEEEVHEAPEVTKARHVSKLKERREEKALYKGIVANRSQMKSGEKRHRVIRAQKPKAKKVESKKASPYSDAMGDIAAAEMEGALDLVDFTQKEKDDATNSRLDRRRRREKKAYDTQESRQAKASSKRKKVEPD